MKQSPLRVPYEPVDVTPVRPNRRQESKQRTRQKVLDAARDLFTERGYEASTIRDIAQRAGMSTGAVFANFQDKPDLFEAVFVEDTERLADALRAAAAPAGPVSERLQAVFAAGYAHSMQNLPLVQAIIAQSWLRPEMGEQRARTVVKGLISIVGEVLRDGVRAGEIRSDIDVRLVSEVLWDCYVSNYRKAVYDGCGAEALEARSADQIALVLGGVRAG